MFPVHLVADSSTMGAASIYQPDYPAEPELLQPASPTPKRALGMWSLGILGFTIVCGGPFGVETTVGQVGPFYAALGLVLLAVLWAAPQAAITAEFATAMPLGGGQVRWVHAACGTLVGTANSWVMTLWQIGDLPSGLILMASYIQQRFPDLSGGALYAIKCAVILVALALNVLGVDALAWSAGSLSLAVAMPFVALPIAVAVYGNGFDASILSPAAAPAGWFSNMPVAFSTMLWCYQGYWAMGALGGEVDNPGRTFAPGAAIAILISTANFVVPVLLGATIAPQLADWQAGFFVQLAQRVCGWLGDWMLAAAVLNNIACFISCFGAYARGIQASALEGDIPLALLGRNMTRWGTPIPALLLLTVTSAALASSIGFDELIVIDASVSTAMSCFLFAAFGWLRYRQPNLPRPFRIPGSNLFGSALVLLPLAALVCFTYYILGTQAAYGPAVCAGVLALAFGMAFVRVRWCGKSMLTPLASSGLELEEEAGWLVKRAPLNGVDSESHDAQADTSTSLNGSNTYRYPSSNSNDASAGMEVKRPLLRG